MNGESNHIVCDQRISELIVQASLYERERDEALSKLDRYEAMAAKLEPESFEDYAAYTAKLQSRLDAAEKARASSEERVQAWANQARIDADMRLKAESRLDAIEKALPDAIYRALKQHRAELFKWDDNDETEVSGQPFVAFELDDPGTFDGKVNIRQLAKELWSLLVERQEIKDAG